MARKAKKKVKKTAKKKVAKARKPKKLKAKVRKPAKKAKRTVKRAKKAAPRRPRAPRPPAAPTPPSPVLMEGMRAPDFRLRAYPDGEYSLADFRGKKVVLYFYPKDDTPGCTMEACSFRDTKSEWEGTGAVVLGVSNDDWASHQNFAQKYNLNFTLLSDPDANVSKAYGVYKEKNMYGKKFWGIERTTFIIDSEGKISKVFPRVQVDGHSAEVLETLRRIS
jgi:peroxiredoxin Q/BCP